MFFLHSHLDHRDLHSFPTRRSSDLALQKPALRWDPSAWPWFEEETRGRLKSHRVNHSLGVVGEKRSEEHTSELQSLRHLVCRLLLEKKKENTETGRTRHHQQQHQFI